ncbi:Maf family protein [Stakelama pacifica]|uniref:Nucleoside triphosphate pyrophosphatase n=1 Tax=Stakelama pacifica TaxID=517720 RepID=A0A4R6FQ13_9SPHN|nr:nucleoside triphosphate pyrophosphatase [Stakelama pacifica]TDN82864.1 septum formation protein [Stakelama pacifica]GGO95368.1 Maf-like protein [Stakelama pacifica]
MRLVLASQSASRRAMLDAAGVPHEAMASGLDEESVKAGFAELSMKTRDLADALAGMKAVRASSRVGEGALVLGCDSIAVRDDGVQLDKPVSRDAARDHLRLLSGRRHDLVSAAVIAEGGRPVWRQVSRARMFMRTLSDEFIEAYLDAEWPEISGCVGCYRLERGGVQLFSRIDGDYFTILGMPLLPILDYLRVRGIMAA